MAHLLKPSEVVHHGTAKKRATVLQCRLIDDHTGTFRLDTLHHALDRRLTEVVTVRFHRQAIDSDHAILLLRVLKVVPVAVAVIAGLAQYLIGDEVLAGTITLHDGGHHVLGYVLVIGQQLLRILG